MKLLINNYVISLFLLVLLALPWPVTAQQQKEKSLYLFKSNWQPAKDISKAAHFMEVTKENDTTYICRYYNKYGPMIRQETYFDSNLTIANGRFCWYDSGGNLDSTGIVYRRNKNGVWSYYNDSLKTTFSLIYDKGRFLEKRNYSSDTIDRNTPDPDIKWEEYLKKYIQVPERFLQIFLTPGAHSVTFSFTINQEDKPEDIYLLRSCEWSADTAIFGAVSKAPLRALYMQNSAKISGTQQQSVTFNTYRATHNSVRLNSDIYVGLLSGAQFPGANNSWNRFLERNLDADVTVEHNAPTGIYTVTVSILIDEEGYVSEVFVLDDPGYGIAEEVIRVIKKSPKWIPAMRDNKPVKYRMKQLLAFSVSETKIDYYDPLR